MTVTISSSGDDNVITCSGDDVSCDADSQADLDLAPSARDIQLIRESWPIVRENQKVFTEFILE